MPRTELILHSVCAELHLAYIQYKLNSLEKRYSIREERRSSASHAEWDEHAATSRAVTGASKKQECPANERRKERARRIKRAWEERRRRPAADEQELPQQQREPPAR
jgi:hypothetical protein